MDVQNLNRRLVIIGLVALVGVYLVFPPEQRLRPGNDIAGGTSLIYEIDRTDAGDDRDLAERVKTQLQRRVDPRGVYDLAWRVLGSDRIEVQMPLPPRDARQRFESYQQSLRALYSHEITRGRILEAVRLSSPQREAALQQLARRNADAILANPGALTPEEQTALERLISQRLAALQEVALRYDALRAAEAARDAAAATPPAEDESPDAISAADRLRLDLQFRDAREIFEDALLEVMAFNLNRRHFEEVLGLEEKSGVRKSSLDSFRLRQLDIATEFDAVVTAHTAWRGQGRQFLDSPADLKRLLRGSGRLEFRILAEPDLTNPMRYNALREALKREGRSRLPTEELQWFKIDDPFQFFNWQSPDERERFVPEANTTMVVERAGSDFYVLGKTNPNDGLLQRGTADWKLVSARPDRDERSGGLCVAFALDERGAQRFGRLTEQNIGRQLCILVDDIAYSAPTIQSRIAGRGQITGDFSLEKIDYLVRSMEAGALPARLKDTPLSERTIGSSLGESNRANAVRAGIMAFVAILIVMLVYYQAAGAVANVALVLNILLILAAMSFLGARITLVGIAGIVLSVGMAIDANVLIYERMREERERGATLRMMIKNGYDKAFSTIFDSNITTLLTCVIIYYAGSEEVKGFGLTLGCGIVLNLFTSIFVTRTFFTLLVRLGWIKDLRMLSIIGVPNIDWVSKRKYFIPLSAGFMLIGLSLLFMRGKDALDVEFRGGMSAEYGVRVSAGETYNDSQMRAALSTVRTELDTAVAALDRVQVTQVPGALGVFDVSVPGIASTRLAAMLTEPLEEAGLLARGGADATAGSEIVRMTIRADVPADKLAETIRTQAGPLRSGVAALGGDSVSINRVLDTGDETSQVWNLTTTATNRALVQHALETGLRDRLEIQPSIEYEFVGVGEQPFPVTGELPSVIAADLPAETVLDLTDYYDGALLYFRKLDPPQTVAALQERLDNMHFQPDFIDLPKRRFEVFGVVPAAGFAPSGEVAYTAIAVAVVDPEYRFSDDTEQWFNQFAADELRLARAALDDEQALRKVMQFKPQIAAAAVQQASLALILSWAAIIGYLWIRFGKPRYGLAGVVALVHDVLIAMAFIGISGWLGGQSHPIGNALLIGDFKINMTVIAALLTIIGYSINDTIVVFDRIRETRGRLGHLTPEIINQSINQTLSRTLMTSLTTIIVLLIMYVWGGSSIRPFNACMILGIITGSYSSIAVAAPLLLARSGPRRSPATAPVPAR